MPPEKDLEQREAGVGLWNYANGLKHIFRNLAAAITERAIPMPSLTIAARTRFQIETGAGGAGL